MQLKALLNVTIRWGICTGVLVGASKLHTLQTMVNFFISVFRVTMT